jgi:hypothetical protein
MKIKKIKANESDAGGYYVAGFVVAGQIDFRQTFGKKPKI